MKDIFLVTPPFTQLNTPYPATAYLKGFFNTKGVSSYQMDLGIEVILALFTRDSLEELFDIAYTNETVESENAQRIYALKADYLRTIDAVITFVQGKNQNLARQICTDNYLPQASRFEQVNELDTAFGMMGFQDKAKHISTLYLEDISDFIIECIDENFGFSRYAERLGRSASSFDEIYDSLKEQATYIDELSLSLLDERLKEEQPKLFCLSVPFPGNLYSAFRCAKFVKANYPEIKIVMGGGFPNTELRSLSDVRVFEFVDFITLDDGELPLDLLWQSISNPSGKGELKRTFICENGEVIYKNDSPLKDYKQEDIGTPDYSDLLLDQYISVIEITNPMHSLWSDGRWNKLTMAHGCYWGKCTFCDGSLDYIKRFEPLSAISLVDRMEELIAQTGETGFHFVDEAAPPALMKAVAIEIIKRKLSLTWWTNIRFEKGFTKDMCALLKASGCIAVSGGLEVASDRMLALINKGTTVEQVARVANNLTESGIMVHAYLMYGFPTETVQETVDSLEMVRQLFEAGIVQSGFWHQFALTVHSPIGLNPEGYGLKPLYEIISFANNDVQFKDKTGIKHDKFSFGLKKSLYNYMHDIGFDMPLQDWFDFKIPRTTIKRGFIQNCLQAEEPFMSKASAKIIWLGGLPLVSSYTKKKKGQTLEIFEMSFHNKTGVVNVSMEKKYGEWFLDILDRLSINEEETFTFATLKVSFESEFENFELFWYSKSILFLRENGLLVV
ncbi:radical SAM protein [Ancylomarina euxinus]|uniref:Radical SAM protein n=1 Tax=Ancylomarina euxinus TaxID=2283627 RepID=A0A425Y8M5_9BACT|nr:B12-binding domain-containing radical SAM protein [Ancylomarina euxinus]MCZ4693358.1 B12-binding domain-containing radical SAM protein [Ancylomarina euxinus]MUP13586.1 radical SAM protein [Ancylomarina euxinus]RRG24767.1 radical SAM protein [Ancylomarina euxinus]